jgi:TatD DNase family protein
MAARQRPDRPDPRHLHLPSGGADAHAHLDGFAGRNSLDEVLARASACGVSTIGQAFSDPAAYAAGKGLYDAWPGVFFTLGVHPQEAMQLTGQALREMRLAFAGDRRLRAVGETGLDFYWKDCPASVQEEAFRLQLSLAAELRLPVVIHSRDAAPRTLAVLEAEGFAGRPVLWHCFSGDAIAALDRLLANGWHMSIPGPITYPANAALREAVTRIPPDRIMLETDCPYLAPQPWRGTENEPALIGFTAVETAKCLGLAPADLWRLCGANVRRFFGLDDAAEGG